MRVSHLVALLKETSFSPEQLAQRLGISNMTVRRWIRKSPRTEIPSLYGRALEDIVFELMGEGILTTESVIVKEIVAKHEAKPFKGALQNLGLSKDFLRNAKGNNEERLVIGLAQIGASDVRRAQVEDNLKKVSTFKRLGKEWSSRITTLLRAIRSKRVAFVEKLVAYGALFYLICLFDLIPDYLPIIGYLDDFAMIGLAADFFLGKISK